MGARWAGGHVARQAEKVKQVGRWAGGEAGRWQVCEEMLSHTAQVTPARQMAFGNISQIACTCVACMLAAQFQQRA